MKINDKELKVFSTNGFSNSFKELEQQLYVNIVNSILCKKPIDMLVFEYNNGLQNVRSAGYDLKNFVLDESTILYSKKSQPVRTFWFKIDDYYDYYVGTFLLPEEY
ncbi:MAG: hypothetical protein M0Q13_14810 [Methanothrix sp.]|nr:hypothetical protein [Methanothrix sp.]